MKLLIPLVLALVGLGGGLAAGHFMRPPADAEGGHGGEDHAASDAGDHDAGGAEGGGGYDKGHGGSSGGDDGHGAGHDGGESRHASMDEHAAHPDGPPPAYDPELKRDYIKMDRQFVVPLVEDEVVSGLIILTLSIEVDEGLGDEVYKREPKLRDRFLQVLFRHAQSGAFDGVFTAGPVMRDLRGALLEAARSVLGPIAHDVLVTDILRQDM